MIKFISKLFKSEEKANIKPDVPIKNVIPEKSASDYLNEGNAYLGKGNLNDAELSYKKALNIDPNNINAYMNLGWVAKVKKNFMLAQQHLLKVTELNPKHFEAFYVLGGIYDEHKKYKEAIIQYENVLKINPDFQFVYPDIAKSYFEIKDYTKAQEIIKTGLAKYPNAPDFHFQLGIFYIATKQYALALKSYEKVIELGDITKELYSNIAKNYLMWGQPDAALAYYEKLFSYPNATADLKLQTLTSLLFNRYYLPSVELKSIFDLAQSINTFYDKKKYTQYIKRNNKLRVGFVSGDLKAHPVAYFLECLLVNMDRNKFELIAYCTDPLEDNNTQRLKTYFNEWNNTGGEDITQKIYNDNIDILIDLSGHTYNNGLVNFIAHPATVQATWLGYWGTTGLESMDYILADEISLSPDEAQYYTEKVKYLPETRLCFTPPIFENVYPTQTPAINKGYITFGCYQNAAKINQEVTDLWARVLEAVPNSKIKLQVQTSQDIRDLIVEKLTKSNISSDRYILADHVPRQEYLNTYNDVDILLDTFPYTGGTTTCEALYMGVPTITLKGNNMIAKQGASMMSAVGLEDWVADTKEDYISIAVEKCDDIESLNWQRQFLRERFTASLLGNTKAFTKNFEQALIEMYEEKTGKKAL